MIRKREGVVLVLQGRGLGCDYVRIRVGVSKKTEESKTVETKLNRSFWFRFWFLLYKNLGFGLQNTEIMVSG